MDLKLIDKLIEKFKAAEITSMEINEGDFTIRLANEVQHQWLPEARNGYTEVNLDQNAPAAPPTGEHNDDEGQYIYINSPMVGTFCTLEKLSKPQLTPGDKVKCEAIIGAIEAMKMICEIESDIAGEFVEYCVNAGDQVEYGQPLVKLKKV